MVWNLQKQNGIKDNVGLLLDISIDDSPLDKQSAYLKINITKYHFVETCSGYQIKHIVWLTEATLAFQQKYWKTIQDDDDDDDDDDEER